MASVWCKGGGVTENVNAGCKQTAPTTVWEEIIVEPSLQRWLHLRWSVGGTCVLYTKTKALNSFPLQRVRLVLLGSDNLLTWLSQFVIDLKHWQPAVLAAALMVLIWISQVTSFLGYFIKFSENLTSDVDFEVEITEIRSQINTIKYQFEILGLWLWLPLWLYIFTVILLHLNQMDYLF